LHRTVGIGDNLPAATIPMLKYIPAYGPHVVRSYGCQSGKVIWVLIDVRAGNTAPSRATCRRWSKCSSRLASDLGPNRRTDFAKLRLGEARLTNKQEAG